MFSIVVKIDGIESRKKSAGLLHIVIGFYLIVKAEEYFRITALSGSTAYFFMFLGSMVSLAYGFLRKRIDRKNIFNSWIRLMQAINFIVLASMYIKTGSAVDYITLYIWAFICLLLLFSEQRVFQDTVIILEEKGIRIPGYYKEHIVYWEELAEVVVREDFITIFDKKKKYMQYQVLQDLSILEVAKMNAFCREKMDTTAGEAVIKS